MCTQQMCSGFLKSIVLGKGLFLSRELGSANFTWDQDDSTEDNFTCPPLFLNQIHCPAVNDWTQFELANSSQHKLPE